MYAAEAVERRGGSTEAATWRNGYPASGDEVGRWVVDQIPPAPDADVLIGKSLGSYGAPVAADRGLPAIWLTPLLKQAWVTDGLRRSTAPFLLIGGSADPLWSSTVARDLTPHVLVIPDADHGLFVPGPLAASATALGQVATAIEDFLDQVVWP
jgi:pimeloyl-ACP methyl ester carboxylesterase